MTAPDAALRPSLRSRLLRQVLLALALIWLLGTLAALWVTHTFTERAFDRALLDDAYAIAANVRLGSDGRLDFGLSARAVQAVLFDQVETVYFAVLRGDEYLLAGNAQLPLAAPIDGRSHRFADLNYHGQALRAVRLQVVGAQPFAVITAQTVRHRRALLRSALAYTLGPQLVLLLALAWWLRRTVQRQLQPLTALQQQLGERDARDLTPLSLPASTRDLQRLEAAVNGLLARLAEGVRAQHEFAGNVAHELRTPLAGIRAQAHYGLAQSTPQAWREQLEGIVQSEARASHLVDQLLALALADEARQAMPAQPVALEQLVQDVLLRFLPRADAAGVDLGAEGLETPCCIRSQPLLIEGILSNLLDNALRYGRPGAGQVARITVTLQRTGAALQLQVQDNGPGLDAVQRQRLAQRWVQGSDGERLGTGAGLGLGIVARYADLLGACLELGAPAQDQGLCVRLVFPAAFAV
ncbi:MAG: sensor histidine kinase N-terminal domain-containing protein [Comamonadaceae bacterium]|jgi:two-component system sensor histidine kinase TctE|nr:sensor histidine kinase N-terminal domain-containing protein [Comamonadaceae bacterium]